MDPQVAEALSIVLAELRNIRNRLPADRAALEALEASLATSLSSQSVTVVYYGGWKDRPPSPSGWGPYTTKIEIVKAIRLHCGVSLVAAKHVVDSAVATIPARLRCPSRLVAENLAQTINDLGGTAEVAL